MGRLLERAKQADPGSAPRRRSCGPHLRIDFLRTQRPYAIVNDYLLAQRAAAQEIVNRRVTEAYQEGYEVGLEFATALPWQAFENFAQSGWGSCRLGGARRGVRHHVTATGTADALRGSRPRLHKCSGVRNECSREGTFPSRRRAHLPIGLSAEGLIDPRRVGSCPQGRATLTTLPRVFSNLATHCRSRSAPYLAAGLVARLDPAELLAHGGAPDRRPDLALAAPHYFAALGRCGQYSVWNRLRSLVIGRAGRRLVGSLDRPTGLIRNSLRRPNAAYDVFPTRASGLCEAGLHLN